MFSLTLSGTQATNEAMPTCCSFVCCSLYLYSFADLLIVTFAYSPAPMDIFTRFKKDYANYFLGIIVPFLINGLSIPVLKHLLGAAGYGHYALYFNALLIANALISGWLSQSVLRFNAKAADKSLFAAQSFFISCLLPAILFLPACIIAWQQQGDFLFGILFAFTLLLASLQLPLQTLTQANFHSRATLYAEALRTTTWFGIAMGLYWLGVGYLYSLFIALFISYAVSVLFLYSKNPLPPFGKKIMAPNGWLQLAKQLSVYGIPMSLWFVFAYLLTYVDKVYMLRYFGPVVQGNYNALFDFLSKGLVLMILPVLTSAFPLLSEAYERGENRVIQSLLRKLMLYELAALAAALILYQLFGYRILFYLLKIPPDPTYVYAGLFIIAGTIIWQIAMLAHKPFELKLRSIFMLLRVAIAFTCQMLFYFFMKQVGNPLIYPAGYCLAAIIYLLLVTIPAIRRNGLFVKQ